MDDLRRLFETNVVATLICRRRCCQACVRGGRQDHHIGSTGGRFTSPGAGAYHMVKYGVEALSLSLGAEVAQFGVRVVLIDPTGVRTPFVIAIRTVHSYPTTTPTASSRVATPKPPAGWPRRPGPMSAPTPWPAWSSRRQGQKPQTPLYRRGFRKSLRTRPSVLSDRMWDAS